MCLCISNLLKSFHGVAHESSCIKNEKQDSEREVQTLLATPLDTWQILYLHTVAVIFKLSTYFEKKMMLLPLNGQKGVVDAVT